MYIIQYENNNILFVFGDQCVRKGLWLSKCIFRKDVVDNDAKLLHFYENASDQFVKHGN